MNCKGLVLEVCLDEADGAVSYEAILEKVTGENAVETELKQKCTAALNKLKERHGISLLFDRRPML